MTLPRPCKPGATILLAEEDVLVRVAVAGYLRDCGLTVIEAASGREAKTVLQHGPEIDVLFADARLAGDDNGFALAQWTRRYRPRVAVVLCVNVEAKTNAAASLCSGGDAPPTPAAFLRQRIGTMRRGRPRSGGGTRAAGG